MSASFPMLHEGYNRERAKTEQFLRNGEGQESRVLTARRLSHNVV